jgi:selenocysteine lyase/cysteine desulfurase
MPEGAVRVSLLHYNTPEDVERLFTGLDALP